MLPGQPSHKFDGWSSCSCSKMAAITSSFRLKNDRNKKGQRAQGSWYVGKLPETATEQSYLPFICQNLVNSHTYMQGMLGGYVRILEEREIKSWEQLSVSAKGLNVPLKSYFLLSLCLNLTTRYLFKTDYVPDTVLSALHIWTHLILTIVQWTIIIPIL